MKLERKAKRYERFGETIRYLTIEELQQFFDVIEDYRHKLMMRVIYELGCRVGEFVRIQLKHLTFSRSTLYFPAENTKTKKRRVSHLPAGLMNEIKSMLRQEGRMAQRTLRIHRPEDYLFSPGRNPRKRYTENRLRQVFSKYVRLAGLEREYARDRKGRALHELTIHSLRQRLILVLDEVDLLSDKDCHKDILYLLARSPRNYMSVLLSNQSRFLSVLDESIRSSLQPESVHFRNYNGQEVFSILQERARQGLHRYREVDLPKIAGLTVRTTNSDVRVAIKTLYYVAIGENNDVESVFDQARRDLVKDVLFDLHDRNILILKAAREAREPFVKEVYARYKRISRELGEEPFSYVYFYSSLSYLQSIGLILLLSTKVGRTYTNRIRLLCDPEVLATIEQARFG